MTLSGISEDKLIPKYTQSITTTYTSTANTWSNGSIIGIALPPSPSFGGAAVTISNGSVVLIQCANAAGIAGFTNTVIRYDPGANSWTTVKSIPFTNVSYISATAISNGSVLTIGGSITTNTYSNACYQYNPAANAWITVNTYPSNICFNAVATLSNGSFNGSVISVGGQVINTSGAITTNCYRYDPGANVWTQIANHPIGMYGGAAATLSNGSVITIAGFDSTWTLQANCYRYDPGANTWTQIANYGGGGVYDLSAAACPNGSIMGISGANATVVVTNCYTYQPLANTWTQCAPLAPSAWQNMAVTTLANGDILAICGANFNYSAFNANVAVFTPASWTTIDLSKGGYIIVTLSNNVSTMTITNWFPNTMSKVTLEVRNQGAYNINNWAGAKWASGTAPTVTSGNGSKDVFVLFSGDGGTTIYGAIIGQNFS